MSEPTGTILDYAGHTVDTVQGPEIAKPGVAMTQERAVLYQAPWQRSADGFCAHARRCARALAAAGVSTHLRSVDAEPPDEEAEKEVEGLLEMNAKGYSVGVYQFTFTPQAVQNRMAMRGDVGLTPQQIVALRRSRVLSTVLERDRISTYHAHVMGLAGQVWVACQANAEALAHSGTPEDMIHVIPVPYFDGDPLLGLAGRKRTPGPVRFYHIGKWEPRKAQDKLVLAFLRATKPGEATLYVKTSESAPRFGQDYPQSPFGAIHSALLDPAVKAMGWDIDAVKRSVFVITERLSDQKLLDLHGTCDVYLSLSRGEGFDMPARDAKLAGNVLVYTPSGGPQDFADTDDIRVEPSGSIPCHPFYRWLPNDAAYLDYNVDVAADAIQRAAKLVMSGAWMRPVGQRAQATEAKVVGQKMRKHLEEVAAERGGKL